MRKRLRDMLARQDNARGFGLARDVKAGQARPLPRGASDAARRRSNRPAWERRKATPIPHYRKRKTRRA